MEGELRALLDKREKKSILKFKLKAYAMSSMDYV